MTWFSKANGSWSYVLWASMAVFSSLLMYQVIKRNNFHIKDQKDSDVDDDGDFVTSKQSSSSSPSKGKKLDESRTGSESAQDEKSVKEEKTVAEQGREKSVEATLLYKEGKYEESIALYEEAIGMCVADKGRKEDLKVMYSNCGAANEKLGRFEATIRWCNEALKVDNRYVKAYRRRARMKEKLADFKGAFGDLLTIVTIQQLNNQEPEMQDADEITRIHQMLAEKATEISLTNKNEVPREYPPIYFLSSYFQSFYAQDDEKEIREVRKESIQVLDDILESLQEEQDQLDEVEVKPSMTAEEREAQLSMLQLKKGETLFYRGLQHQKEKRFELAATDFLQASKLLLPENENYGPTQLLVGTYAHLKGEFEDAEKHFKLCLEVRPQSIVAHIRLAGLSFDRKDIEQAIEWFDKTLAFAPNAPTAYYHRGQLFALSGEFDKSIQDFEKCVALAPDFAMAYMQLGMSTTRTGNFQAGLDSCKKAIELDPTVPEGYSYAGEIYVAMEKPKEAMQMFDKAIEVDPKYPIAYVNKGVTTLRSEMDGGKALKLFQKAIEVSPRCQVAFFHIAQLCLQLGQAKTAIRQIDEAIKGAFTREELYDLNALRITAEAQEDAQRNLSMS